MHIYIDADGCPVVGITVEIAKKYGIPATVVCDTSHLFSSDYANVITVEKGADSADFKLVNLINAGDIAITQDYGLAAMCLSRSAIPISQNGLVFTDSNIDTLLYSRYVNKEIMRAGGRIKGPKKREKHQNDEFAQVLEKMIVKHLTTD